MDTYTEEGKIISSEIVLPEDGEKGEKSRHLSGFFGLLEKALLIAIPISGVIFALDIFISLKVVIYKQQYMSIFLGLVLASIFLGKPASRSARNCLPWYDIVLAGMSLGIGIFCCVVYPHYLITGIGYVGLGYPVLGVLITLLVIEASRRVTGWILVALAVMCIFYALFTWLFPSPFYGRGTSWDELSVYFFMDSNGILGIPLWVTSSMIFGFILFGEFLSSVGGAQIINEFAFATVGKFRGGPAKVSVISSGLFGTVSGSVVANVVVDGWITIPLMKKTGYSPEVAGAIEAAASTGGQLMPPVMGAAAFLMAEFLSIPYAQVAIAALVPAIIYYYALFLQVDMEAGKKGIKGVPGKTPPIWPILKKSWIVSFPLVVLVYTLFILNFQPGKSSIAGVTSMIIIGFLTKETRLGFHKFLNILERAGRGILMIGAVTALAGIIVGGIFISGASTALTITLVNLAGLNLFLMLIITAILCIILGMGMATAGVYLILGVIIAPSLVQIGVVPLAAHLFIFYFGLMSMVTPPVCFAVYAASAIADTSIMKTGLAAVRLGFAGYIAAFLFVYSPELLLIGGVQEIVLTVARTFVGITFLTIAFVGFYTHRLDSVKRLLLILGGFALLIPSGMRIPITPWQLNIGGLVLCVSTMFWDYWKYKHLTRL